MLFIPGNFVELFLCGLIVPLVLIEGLETPRNYKSADVLNKLIHAN